MEHIIGQLYWNEVHFSLSLQLSGRCSAGEWGEKGTRGRCQNSVLGTVALNKLHSVLGSEFDSDNTCTKNLARKFVSGSLTDRFLQKHLGLKNQETIVLFLDNKDHQRMMVDPRFMIFQSLRPFLTVVTPTAVTPTAVTPIVVILPEFTWIFLNFPYFTSITLIYQKLPELTGVNLNLPEFTKIYLNLTEFTWIYLNLPQITQVYMNWPAFHEFNWIYLNLPESTLIYHNLPALTLIYLILPEFTWIYLNLPGFTWIYLNLPEFT